MIGVKKVSASLSVKGEHTMGYMFALIPCVRCKRPFSCNPDRVPSLRVNAKGVPDPNGTREGICEPCFDLLNATRVSRGLPAWPEPLPGAYEPENEDEG